MKKISLYQGDSLDTFLKIQNCLKSRNIQYDTECQTENGIFQMLASLFTLGRPSSGLSDDHRQHYCIFVDEIDYERAREAAGFFF